jgi:arylsulfatase A-like enzyme
MGQPDEVGAQLLGPLLARKARILSNKAVHLPHVVQMQKQGTTFSHYFVTDSLCCPSRSSIFTGKYPHNTTVFSNGGDAGGYPQFERAGNATQTFAAVLEPAGYQTRMMGKYLNGYVPRRDQKDPGWTGWNVAGEGGYNEFVYELNNDGVVKLYPRNAMPSGR